VEVRYADQDLRDLCADERALRCKYGAEGAKKVGMRLAALAAAESIDDLMRMPGKCHPLKGGYYQDCFAFWLHAGYRLVFRPMTDEEREEQQIPDEVAALVVEIIDYHSG
jgi:plasmid maintenance system killer protein